MKKLSMVRGAQPFQLELMVDGLPLLSAPWPAYAVKAAIASLPPARQATLDQLRQLPHTQIGVLSDHFDPVTVLLNMLGIHWSRIASEDLGSSDVGIVFAGCPHRHTRLDRYDLEPFLSRGGLLVSSDRAAMMVGLAPFLDIERGAAPGRARVDLREPCRNGDVADGLLPTVALDPGHRPLSQTILERPGVRELASNVLSGGPLAILAAVRGGMILHSTAHWFQELQADRMTAFDRKPLASIACYAHIGNSYPNVSLAAFQAARTMLDIFLAGVELWNASNVSAFNLQIGGNEMSL